MHLRLTLAIFTLIATALSQVPHGGYTLSNERMSNDELITKENINTLKVKWTIPISGDVTATAAILTLNGISTAFFPDWAGFFYAVNVETGALIWKVNMNTWQGARPTSHSRTSPTYDAVNNRLIVCDQIGARVYSVKPEDGTAVWSTIINTHVFSQITGSPTLYNNVIYVGANSGEEGWQLSGIPNYKCCNFRGSFSALDALTGAILWTTHMVPENGGLPDKYSGAGVWGSNPPIDPVRGQIYINTGNYYKVPATVNTCLSKSNAQTANDCFAADAHGTSMLALNIADGSIAWATRLTADVWNSYCVPNTPCMGSPAYLTSDYDFAQGNILFSIGTNDFVAGGQKSGILWKLNRDTGKIVQSVQAGPGNSGGGMMFGSSADENNIYIANNNAGFKPFKVSSGADCTAGIFAAIRKIDMTIAWSICNPSGGRASAATTVTRGGIVFVSSRDNQGWLYALDATNGAVLWQFQSGATNSAGASITDGLVLWGSGYARYGLGTRGNTFYAFEVPREQETLPPYTPPPTPEPTLAPSYAPNTILPSTAQGGVITWEPNTITINLGDDIIFEEMRYHLITQVTSDTSSTPVTGGITISLPGETTYTLSITREDVQNTGSTDLYFVCPIHPTMRLKVMVVLPEGETIEPITEAPAPTFGGTGPQSKCPAAGEQSSVYNQNKDGIRYFVDEMPIPRIATPKATESGVDEYDISITEYRVSVHSDLPPIMIRGYGGILPGPTIEAMQGRPVRVNWINNLFKPTLLKKVETIPHDMSRTGIVTHLHGHDNDQPSDGLPEQTVEVNQTFTTYYENEQHPGLLWYHDHAMGITRANVYMGLAGLYIIRSPSETNLNLPNYQHELPLLIQDRIIIEDDTGDMIFYYPNSWTMAWYGEVMMVNGKVWPKSTVTPARYRLRIVNGANARFLDLSFSNNMEFTIIANDQGYLQQPVSVKSVLLAPGERVDVLVDFCDHGGEQIILQNTANAPYPGNDGDYSGTDPCLQGRVMMFDVTGPSECTSVDLSRYSDAETHPVLHALEKDASKRDLVLGIDGGFLVPKLGILSTKGLPLLYSYEDTATEIVQNGTLEIWRIINLTPDAHPIHLHVSAFRILGRQNFDVELMKKTGKLEYHGDMMAPEPYESGPKDTVRCDTGTVTSILIKFTSKTGRYMWHCHMLEHEENAMMRPMVITASGKKTGIFNAADVVRLSTVLLAIIFVLLSAFCL